MDVLLFLFSVSVAFLWMEARPILDRGQEEGEWAKRIRVFRVLIPDHRYIYALRDVDDGLLCIKHVYTSLVLLSSPYEL